MKISIVIPLFNSENAIASCLRSLAPQWPSDAEVIVVDNGSTDGAAAAIRRDHPGIRIIRNEKNEGAARARNQGIQASRGAWVMSLDCDVVLHPAFFKEISSEIERAAPRTGMIQAKILNDDGLAIFSTGISLTALRRFKDRGQGQKDRGQFDEKKDIFGPCSAAAVYRRSLLDGVKDRFGYFDERFFFLVEDVDLAWRAQRAGWRAVFCPAAVCAHKGDSSKTNRFLRQAYCFRNRRLMLEKNEKTPGRWQQFYMSFFYDGPRGIYLSLANPYFKSPFRDRLEVLGPRKERPGVPP
jgi:GT2 family glycosyltransferase